MSAVSQALPAASHLPGTEQKTGRSQVKAVNGRPKKNMGGRGSSSISRARVQSWSLSPVRVGKLFISSSKCHAQPPTASVSIHLPLIGFNERFNSTTPENQIKLLLCLILGHSFVMKAISSRPPLCGTLPILLQASAAHLPPVFPFNYSPLWWSQPPVQEPDFNLCRKF